MLEGMVFCRLEVDVLLFIESHVEERERNAMGESPTKLGGREERDF